MSYPASLCDGGEIVGAIASGHERPRTDPLTGDRALILPIVIVIVLGIAGDLAGLPIVESMIRDRDPQVVRAAERAVARLQAIRRAT